MHELGIVFYAIDAVENVGRQNGLSSVARVTMSLGEVSGVIPSYLEDCWKWAVKRSDLLHDARLEIEEIPAVTVCNDCGRTYPTVQYGKTCPYCGSDDTVLLRGNEVEVKEIEAC